MKTRELTKLRRVFKNLEPDTGKVVEQLIINAAFMAERLESLREEISEKGNTVEYKNGREQFGTTANPAIKQYNDTIKEYRQVIKQLTDLLPKNGTRAEKDELMDFLGKSRK